MRTGKEPYDALPVKSIIIITKKDFNMVINNHDDSIVLIQHIEFEFCSTHKAESELALIARHSRHFISHF